MAKKLYFDIETNGLYTDVTKGHCLVIIDDENNVLAFRPETFHKGVLVLLEALKNGDIICGHNIIAYDIPVLEKLYPDFKVTREMRKQVIDTLVLSRLIYSNLDDTDHALVKRNVLPVNLIGRHSLKAWGYRLGELKGTYGEKEEAWKEYSEEMLSYCVQDVTVTKKLANSLERVNYPSKAIEVEHQIAWLMAQQERNGFTFDTVKAEKLLHTLEERYAVLSAQILAIIPQIPDKVFIPKRDNKRLGYVAGVPIQRYKDFNPNSRQQIQWVLENKFNYHPTAEECFKDDKFKLDSETFKFIKQDPEAPEELRELAGVFEELLIVSKRLGQLATGTQAWLKHVQSDGKIHGSVNPCGAVTGRATHSNPNMAQIPHVGSPYGQECRELFTVPKDWYFVGTDACGLELRCLAHYLYPYDRGEYAHEILNGDIHTKNQNAAGLPTRNSAKTFIYAFLYGAGDRAIGKQLGGDEKLGKKVKKKFLQATPSIALLRQAVENALVVKHHGQIVEWKRKYLKGLDGRFLHVRSLHSALNLLLQACGALICKKWVCLTEENLVKLGLDHGKDFQYMAWTHDEISVACRTAEIADTVARVAQESMRQTQQYYKIRVDLDTEAKIGFNWFECH